MRLTPGLARFVSAFIYGFALILPLMNQSGVITVYEAIPIVWLLFLIPAFLLHRSVKRISGGKGGVKVTLAAYILVSSVYSVLEPVMAGYNLGYFAFLIPVVISFLLFLPSLWVRHRFYFAKPKEGIPTEQKYTENLRNMLAGIDVNPPEVSISDMPLRIGRSYVTYTDGIGKRILIHSDATTIFSEDELNAIILKKYFEMKNRDALKFIYTSNLAAIVVIDGLILSAILETFLNGQPLISLILIGAMLVFVGLIISLPLILRNLVIRKEVSSDLKSVRLSGNPENLKSYIIKSLENYKPSPLMTDKRLNRVRKVLEKQDLYRIRKMETSTPGR